MNIYNATVKNIIIFLYLYCPLVLNANAPSKLILANYGAAPPVDTLLKVTTFALSSN